MNMRNILKKTINRETVTYLIFGLLTTVINYAVFWLFLKILGGAAALIANVVAFVFATSFAYVTNKLFVFQSCSWKGAVIRKEILSFLSARVLSFLFEEAGLFVCANLLKLGRYTVWGIDGIMLSKIILSLVVVAINYVLSKFLIFKDQENRGD